MKNKNITDYNKANEQAECEKILTKVLLQKGLDRLAKGIDINTDNGIEHACKALVLTLFGERGYYKDITLLEVLKKGDEAKYSIFIGVKGTPLMKEFLPEEPIGVNIYIKSSK